MQAIDWSDAGSRVADTEQPCVSLFGLSINRLSMDEAVQRISDWCQAPRGPRCRYVVTPNVDHVVMYQKRQDLQAAYDAAALVLADGAPVVWSSRLLGRPLPERVAGSDLAPRLFEHASKLQGQPPLRVFLLGAAPGVAERAASRIIEQWNGVQVAGTYSPPLGFENDPAENDHILKRVAEASPDLLIVGFGAPKQELWIQAHSRQLEAKVALCVGATIDFLAGHRRRAPRWMRYTGLEWVHRVYKEPKRLAMRYARDAWVFPQLFWRELARSNS